MKQIDWDARYAAEPTLWGEAPNQFVRARLADAEPGRAVDLACGNGRNAVWLARRGWRVDAVDISAVAIEQARERSAQAGVEVGWDVGDALAWKPDGPIDLALVVYLHVPLPDLIGLLSRAATWLAPGGRLLYVGHARTNLDRGVGGPSDPGILAEIADLAAAAEGLRVTVLSHLLRRTDNGSARDASEQPRATRASEERARSVSEQYRGTSEERERATRFAIDILLEATPWPEPGATELPDPDPGHSQRIECG